MPHCSFNTQPPEGGWLPYTALPADFRVSTHSRPKAAGTGRRRFCRGRLFQHTAARRRLAGYDQSFGWEQYVSTHSRPKAAGCRYARFSNRADVSTHSRPKAAGSGAAQDPMQGWVSTHSRPKAAGEYDQLTVHGKFWFQHTAARRRLGCRNMPAPLQAPVSTHSRPKAAGINRLCGACF